MDRQTNAGRTKIEMGQAVIEVILSLPFLILLLMVLSEFGIYFFRTNELENVAQTAGRMVARRATYDEMQAYVNQNLGHMTPQVSVQNDEGMAVTTWEGDERIKIRITGTVPPVFPLDGPNLFTPGVSFFPAVFTLQSVKTVFVE